MQQRESGVSLRVVESNGTVAPKRPYFEGRSNMECPLSGWWWNVLPRTFKADGFSCLALEGQDGLFESPMFYLRTPELLGTCL